MLRAFLAKCWQRRLVPFAFSSYPTCWHHGSLTEVLTSLFYLQAMKTTADTENTQLLLVHSIAGFQWHMCWPTYLSNFNQKTKFHLSVMTPGGSVRKHQLFSPLLDTFPSLLSTSSNDFPFLHLLKARVSKQQFVGDFRRQKCSCVFLKNSSNLANFGTLLLSWLAK